MLFSWKQEAPASVGGGTFTRHVMSAEHEDVAHREIGRHFFIDYIANLWYNDIVESKNEYQ